MYHPTRGEIRVSPHERFDCKCMVKFQLYGLNIQYNRPSEKRLDTGNLGLDRLDCIKEIQLYNIILISSFHYQSMLNKIYHNYVYNLLSLFKIPVLPSHGFVHLNCKPHLVLPNYVKRKQH